MSAGRSALLLGAVLGVVTVAIMAQMEQRAAVKQANERCCYELSYLQQTAIEAANQTVDSEVEGILVRGLGRTGLDCRHENREDKSVLICEPAANENAK